MTDKQDAAIGAAGSLTVAVAHFTEEVSGLRADIRKSKRVIRILAFSLLFDLLLTVGLAYSVVRANDGVSTGRHAYASNQALCVATNTARAQQRALWTYLLRQLGPPKTSAAKLFEKRFERHLDFVFMARDCAALGGKAK